MDRREFLKLAPVLGGALAFLDMVRKPAPDNSQLVEVEPASSFRVVAGSDLGMGQAVTFDDIEGMIIASDSDVIGYALEAVSVGEECGITLMKGKA